MISEWASNPHEPSNPIVMPGLVPGIHVVAPSSEGSGTTTDRCAAPVDVEGELSKTLAGRRRGSPVDDRDKPGHDVLGVPAIPTNFSFGTLEFRIPFGSWQPVRHVQPRDAVGRKYVAFGRQRFRVVERSYRDP